MRKRWIRLEPDRKDDAAAAVLAVTLGLGVGAVAFYLVRLFLAREPLDRGDGEA